MKREIVFDTETTGMDPADGDKLVEIGCVEVIDFMPTGRVYHQYINPERDVPAGAVAVHGLTNEFLADKPTFSQIFHEFTEFIEGATLIAHNASFDMKFINWELKSVGYPSIPSRYVKDTLQMARQKFPGAPATLDALCRRFNIDLSGRELHGALLDAELLAEVYLELMGGRQHGLSLAEQEEAQKKSEMAQGPISFESGADDGTKKREPRIYKLTEEEMAAHEALLEQLTDPLWKKRA